MDHGPDFFLQSFKNRIIFGFVANFLNQYIEYLYLPYLLGKSIYICLHTIVCRREQILRN